MMSLTGDTVNNGPPADSRSRSIAFVVSDPLTPRTYGTPSGCLNVWREVFCPRAKACPLGVLSETG